MLLISSADDDLLPADVCRDVGLLPHGRGAATRARFRRADGAGHPAAVPGHLRPCIRRAFDDRLARSVSWFDALARRPLSRRRALAMVRVCDGVFPGGQACGCNYPSCRARYVAALRRDALVFLVGAVAVSTPVQAGEEIGWRGYALPRLAARFGLARASLILGVIWAAWHLPLFFIPGVDNYGQSFSVFLIGVIALSVAMAWLYVRANSSLWLVMLMHSVVNQTPLIIPSANPTTSNPFAPTASLVGWVTVMFLWAGAAYLLVRMQGEAGETSRRGRAS
jgi:CAAX prenyl protease-like protein